MKGAKLDTDLKYIEDPIVLQKNLTDLVKVRNQERTKQVELRGEYLHRTANSYEEGEIVKSSKYVKHIPRQDQEKQANARIKNVHP